MLRTKYSCLLSSIGNITLLVINPNNVIMEAGRVMMVMMEGLGLYSFSKQANDQHGT